MPEGYENSAEDKTEAPTQFRREEFRRQGHVALSKELQSVVILSAIGFSFYYVIGFLLREFSSLLEKQFTFSKIVPFEKESVIGLLGHLTKDISWMLFPIAVVSMGVGILVAAAQVGFHVTWEPLSPKWERLNPINGLQRLFSWHGTVDALKAILKLIIALGVLWFFLKSQVPTLSLYFEKDIPEVSVLMFSTVGKLFFLILATMAIVAVGDYGFQKFQLEKQMRMSKREAKDEFKMREGDPLIRSRIRAVQRKMANRRMMESVPKADAIVTNPTHIAVALKYDSKSMDAPKVTAKGQGFVAEKIKEIARFHRIPIIENKPLARTLFKKIEINQSIPRELYKAVAEVLAYVYRLRGVTRTASAQVA